MGLKRVPESLSKTERLRLDAIAECSTVKDAAQKLKIPDGTLYNWLSDLRVRIQKERSHINAILAQGRRSELLKRELSIRRPVEADLDEEDAES